MSGDPPVVPRAATLIPGYTVISHLSRGRRLDVYDVWSEKRNCRCVAKVMRPDCIENRRVRRRLVREGRTLLAASHPHIVRAYELVARPQPAVILETLSGDTLDGLVARRQKRLSRTEVSFLGLHLASAIGYLHSRGVLHLDLKPSNVICHTDGRAILIDLSIAGRLGRSRRPRGTHRYMPPEQFGWQSAGPAADVWGIGVVLFAASTGGEPFPDADRSKRAPSLVLSRPRFPTELIELVDACLEPIAGARPTIAELSGTLGTIAERTGSLTPVPEGLTARWVG